MKLILKHLTGDEQYRFLDKLLPLDMFRAETDYKKIERQNKVIQAIMNEVNKE